MNSRNFSKSALMEFSQFLPCMFSPVEYNAAKSLGEAAKRNSRHFFLHVQSCIVLLCTLRRKDQEKQHNTWTELSPICSWHFQACFLLCAILSHWDMKKMVKRASKKHQNGGLGGLGEALGGLGGPSTVSYGKRNPKSGSLTPSDTFLGTPFWTLFEPWAHIFHVCSRFRLKNLSTSGCIEFCSHFSPFSDVHLEATTF